MTPTPTLLDPDGTNGTTFDLSLDGFSPEEWLCIHDTKKSLNLNISAYMDGGDVLSFDQLGPDNFTGGESESRLTCNRSWDGILCWPEVYEGTAATLPCFSELHGIMYDTSRTVSRICEEGGTWENVTNYTSCVPLGPNSTDDSYEGLGTTIHVYFFGYCLSLVALIIAMIIFVSINCSRPVCTVRGLGFSLASSELRTNKYSSSMVLSESMELRCLRNKIHTQLIVTYIMAAILWIITSSTTEITSMSLRGSVSSHLSCITFILLHYFHLTNFFWMFVEGLYLYVLVVQTFMAGNIKLRIYAAIGWGLPFLVVTAWSIAKWTTQSAISSTTTETVVTGTGPDGEMNISCIVLGQNELDWIYKIPAILVLFANILFLIRIMWVLITKLRSATSPETQQSRKAAKALVVLMPLLGITYVFILTGPRKLPTYEHLRALLISTQGFLVALLYCFLNGEVRIALRHRWNRINTTEGPCSWLGYCCCFCCWNRREGRRRHLQHVRDWSPRSRTESIRLYAPTNYAFRKRESSATSETTTMTSLHGRTSLNGSIGIQPLNPSAIKRLSTLSNFPAHHRVHTVQTPTDQHIINI